MVKDIVNDEFTEMIFFPLHHVNHWTLLTLDYNCMEWRHYDSLRPRRSGAKTNEHYKQALEMVRIFDTNLL